MKHLKILTALTLGIMASSSGMIQTQAALYTFSVDFSTKEVANFNDFRQSYSSTTYDLGASITWNWSGSYSFNTCPTIFTLDTFYERYWQLNGVGTIYDFGFQELPNFICSTNLTTYSQTVTSSVSDQFILAVINDDANHARIIANLGFRQAAASSGVKLRLHNYTTFLTLNYNFDTTYLFNYFLSDTQFNQQSRVGSWVIGSNPSTNLNYVYTTAGNDEYRLVNSDALGNIGTLRKKYAIDYNLEFFRGQSVGARIRRTYDTLAPYTYDELTLGSSGISLTADLYRYYYLNTANEAQAIVDAPLINFTEENCSGGFLDINVGCYVNNAIAYLVNDAPVISDAFTLLNTGIELAAQTFGIIGSFSDDNVFGYLILVGFGFIAVKWFLKNDE